ncbi:MAG: hypothetical protein L0956_05130 [Candidatus Mariimomonas ferrooxydans]
MIQGREISGIFFFLTLLLALSGCGGGGSSSSSISATALTWEAPTMNEDGTRLTDLGGYILYYGASHNNYSEVMSVDTVTTFPFNTIPGLESGMWCFAVKAYSTSGYESDYSDEVCVDF